MHEEDEDMNDITDFSTHPNDNEDFYQADFIKETTAATRNDNDISDHLTLNSGISLAPTQMFSSKRPKREAIDYNISGREKSYSTNKGHSDNVYKGTAAHSHLDNSDKFTESCKLAASCSKFKLEHPDDDSLTKFQSCRPQAGTGSLDFQKYYPVSPDCSSIKSDHLPLTGMAVAKRQVNEDYMKFLATTLGAASPAMPPLDDASTTRKLAASTGKSSHSGRTKSSYMRPMLQPIASSCGGDLQSAASFLPPTSMHSFFTADTGASVASARSSKGKAKTGDNYKSQVQGAGMSQKKLSNDVASNSNTEIAVERQSNDSWLNELVDAEQPGDMVVPPSRSKARWKATCPLCEREFVDASTRNRHVRVIHERKVKWTCPVCNHNITRSDNIKHHSCVKAKRTQPP